MGYEGLHRWNFDNDDDDLIVWSPDTRHSVRSSFGDLVQVKVSYDGEWINCALSKTKSALG